MKSDFEESRKRRIEHYHEWLKQASTEAHQEYQTSHQMAQAIPFGQPMLVSHRLEKRACMFIPSPGLKIRSI